MEAWIDVDVSGLKCMIVDGEMAWMLAADDDA